MPVAARAIKRGCWASAASLFALRNDDNVVRALALPALRKGAARRQGERRSAAGASALVKVEMGARIYAGKSDESKRIVLAGSEQARGGLRWACCSCSRLTDRFMRIV